LKKCASTKKERKRSWKIKRSWSKKPRNRN